ncbi:MAG: tetratricopeptide repeat protein [Desulfurella sp.]
MKSKLFSISILLFFIFFVSSCSTTVPFHIKPTNLEPPKQVTKTKLPYTATFIVENETLTDTKYDTDIISVHVKYILPTQSMVLQGVEYYLEPYFKKSDHKRNYLELYGKNHVYVNIKPNNLIVKEDLGFSKKSLAIEVNINTNIYDDYYIISQPYSVSLKGTIEKTGFFSSFSKEEYSKAATMSITKDLEQLGQRIAYVLNNQSEIISNANVAIEKEPLNLENYILLANLSLKNGNYKDAISASKMIIKLEPNNIIGYDLLARSYYKSGQMGLAKKVFSDAIAQNVQDAKRYYITFLVEAKEYDSAIVALKQSQVPLNPRVITETLFGVNKYESVMSVLKEALDKQQYNGIGIVFSYILSDSGYPMVKSVNPLSSAVDVVYKDDEIVEINNQSTKNIGIEKTIELIKKEPNAINDIVIKRKNNPDLIKLSLKTQKLYTPDSFSTYAWMAFVNYFLNDKRNFYEYADLSYKLNPKGNISTLAKALALIDSSSYDKAIDLLNNVDFLGEASMLKATAYAQKKDYNNALSIYKLAQQNQSSVLFDKFKPIFFEAVSSFVSEKLSTASQLKNQGEYRKALEYYQVVLDIVDNQKKQQIYYSAASIVALDPSVVELNEDSKKSFIHAQMYYQENNLEKAIAQLSTVIEKNPFNPNLHHDIALLYAQTQDYKKAIEHMNVYLTLMPNANDAQAAKDEIVKWEFKLKGE